MKISNRIKESQAIQSITQEKKGASLEKTHSAQIVPKEFLVGYKMDFSAQARDMNRIFDVLAATPDCRIGKVQAVKQAIEKGEYQISSDILVGKMIRESLGG